MEKMYGARYTLEYKLEALRLIGTGQSMAAVAATLGLAVRRCTNTGLRRNPGPSEPDAV